MPHGNWKTTTFVAGLRNTGMMALMVLDGPINRDAFTAYVTQVLVPELSPGDIVIMDNLSSHNAPAIREAIEDARAELLFLRAYSPGLPPHRKGILQAQGEPAKSRRALHPRPMGRHRSNPRNLLSAEIRQLLQSLRTWCNASENRSSCHFLTFNWVCKRQNRRFS